MSCRVKNTHFSNRLKKLRRDLGYKSAEAFAEKYHFSVYTYKEWESKGHMPTLASLETLAGIFNVSIDYLLGRSDYLRIGDESISEITGLSKQSIEVLRYIKEAKEPYCGIGSDNFAEKNALITEMINELLEDSYDSLAFAKKETEKHPGVCPLDSLFGRLYEYVYFDKVKMDINSQQGFSINTGYQNQLCSTKELFREMTLRRIIYHLDNLSKKHVK